MKLFAKRPWLAIEFAFIVLIAAWTKLVLFAGEHADVPIDPAREAPR